MAVSLGRGEVRETEAREIHPGLQNVSTVSISVAKMLYYTGSPFPYECGFGIPSFAAQGSFWLDCARASLRERLAKLSEIIGRLTCFMTMDDWLTSELHKNNHFYTFPSVSVMIPDKRVWWYQTGGCEMSSVARPITHITSCLWGTESLGGGDLQTQVNTFFFTSSTPFNSYGDRVKSCCCLHCCNLNGLYFSCSRSSFKMRHWLLLLTAMSFSSSLNSISIQSLEWNT